MARYTGIPETGGPLRCIVADPEKCRRSRTRLGCEECTPIRTERWGGLFLYEIAAAYAFHLAESQAYFVGNKTAVEAALDFLEINGVDTSPWPELAAYEGMIRVANHELDRSGLAVFSRETLKPKI